LIAAVAPHAAAIKFNRNHLKDQPREVVSQLVEAVHTAGMVAIDDSKLADIGESNHAGLAQAAAEGFDAVTYAPFPGNVVDTARSARDLGLGLIVLVLMSNPEFEVIKNARIGGQAAYEFFAQAVAAESDCGLVIGAPSPRNHLTADEVLRVRALTGPRVVLVPGIGAQGGDPAAIVAAYGALTIANVGRAITSSKDPSLLAAQYQEQLGWSD
jgi:orotidine-5'-phosphate decarboxylase